MARQAVLALGIPAAVLVMVTSACRPTEEPQSHNDASAGQAGQRQASSVHSSGGSFNTSFATGGSSSSSISGGTTSATGGVATLRTGGAAGVATTGVATGGAPLIVASAGNAATLAGASSIGGAVHQGGVSTSGTVGSSMAGAAGTFHQSGAAGVPVAGRSGSAGSSGMAGGPSPSQRVLAPEQTLTGFELYVSIYDGFRAPSQSESYIIDLATREVKFTSSVTGAALSSATVTASAEALQQVLDTLRETEYRAQPDCRAMAIDGAAYPPRLTLVNGTSKSAFSVSNATCTKSDHSAYGNVMSCGAFSAILDRVRAIVSTGQSAGCQSYW